jgi:hypothetical protein
MKFPNLSFIKKIQYGYKRWNNEILWVEVNPGNSLIRRWNGKIKN